MHSAPKNVMSMINGTSRDRTNLNFDPPQKAAQAESLKSSTVEETDSGPETTGSKRPAKKGTF